MQTDRSRSGARVALTNCPAVGWRQLLNNHECVISGVTVIVEQLRLVGIISDLSVRVFLAGHPHLDIERGVRSERGSEKDRSTTEEHFRTGEAGVSLGLFQQKHVGDCGSSPKGIPIGLTEGTRLWIFTKGNPGRPHYGSATADLHQRKSRPASLWVGDCGSSPKEIPADDYGSSPKGILAGLTVGRRLRIFTKGNLGQPHRRSATVDLHQRKSQLASPHHQVDHPGQSLSRPPGQPSRAIIQANHQAYHPGRPHVPAHSAWRRRRENEQLRVQGQLGSPSTRLEKSPPSLSENE
ncbi:hypothetical protein LR48_Vigan04g168400 [Vigna angularis]|uniref:Uncharacterized protein n=1 Tax=Phaseolus angularis TaxID=3914 RepID=A0A0L9UFL5_PHAAN|nr:hypothetical protein LR48_Vigan04g168400 [Vigna angularis]